jgi:serine/threonine protein kinase
VKAASEAVKKTAKEESTAELEPISQATYAKTRSGTDSASLVTTTSMHDHQQPVTATQAEPLRLKEGLKDKDKVIMELQAICTDADPTRLYGNLVKIDQGASADIYTADQVGTNLSVAIKRLYLDKQPQKDRIIDEILLMRSSRHPNIVNYIDSFLYKNDIWVVMEYMEGGCLTDVIMASVMTEAQISAVSRETAQGV